MNVPKFKEPDKEKTTLFNTEVNMRNLIAGAITLVILFVTVILAFKVMGSDDGKNKAMDLITKTFIPLWATWIGTILTFYFSRENFEAASKSYRDVIEKLSPDEKLKTMSVNKIMVPFEQLVYLHFPADLEINIYKLLHDPRFEKYDRFVMIDDSQLVKSLIHRRNIHQFASESLEHGADPDKIKKTKLKEFLEGASPEIRNMNENAMSFVANNATLLDAKKAMESIVDCKDVFITANGKKSEAVLGLITNTMLLSNAEAV